MTADRFSDEYDPEPDYDRPTRAEAEAEVPTAQEVAAAKEYLLGAYLTHRDDFKDAPDLRAHLNRVHYIGTADIDDFVLDTVHAEAHGFESPPAPWYATMWEQTAGDN